MRNAHLKSIWDFSEPHFGTKRGERDETIEGRHPIDSILCHCLAGLRERYDLVGHLHSPHPLLTWKINACILRTICCCCISPIFSLTLLPKASPASEACFEMFRPIDRTQEKAQRASTSRCSHRGPVAGIGLSTRDERTQRSPAAT